MAIIWDLNCFDSVKIYIAIHRMTEREWDPAMILIAIVMAGIAVTTAMKVETMVVTAVVTAVVATARAVIAVPQLSMSVNY